MHRGSPELFSREGFRENVPRKSTEIGEEHDDSGIACRWQDQAFCAVRGFKEVVQSPISELPQELGI